MRRVGFITAPLTSGHAVRGIGFYVKRLLPELKKQAEAFAIEIIEAKDDSELRAVNYDLVHYPFFDLFFPTLPLNLPTKAVVTVHDVIPLQFPRIYPPGLIGWLNLQRQRQAVARVDLVLTDSMASVKAIIKHLAVPSAKLRLVYLAADEQFRPISNRKLLEAVRRKYQLPTRFVLYVGDVNWNKNLPSLVKACKTAQMPLVLVGKQATEIESMDLSHPQLRHLQGIDWSSVYRLGFVSDADLVAIYNLATVYCQPSFAEGFGLTVLEALASDTPVAASRAHSLPEVGGGAVAYFDPGDVDSIVKALGQAPKISGRREQAAKFSWAKTARQTIQVYRQLVAGGRPDQRPL